MFRADVLTKSQTSIKYIEILTSVNTEAGLLKFLIFQNGRTYY